MTDTPSLRRELKELLIESCKLRDVSPDDIGDDLILFQSSGELGLDSIDALEFVLALQKAYGVRIDDQNISRVILQSIRTVSDFIEAERAAGRIG